MSDNDKLPPREKWSAWFRLSQADRHKLTQHRWLRPVAHRLHDPKLWQMQHEAVARGAAIGVFWAFAAPVAQLILAAVCSVFFRANIPVAMGTTLITNPFTIGFWLYLAYEVGAVLIDAPPRMSKADSSSTLAWVTSFGWPAVIGMGLFAVFGSVAAYLLVKLGWRARIWIKRRGR
ncbi:MAG: DUF2062 domain-containing protein [Polaromonas sp.]|nr:DUF2062 domain-containing protein [Polaromonas sp.]